MKLPLLLSQYLREHQQLQLPGLGSFYASSLSAGSDADAPSPSLNVRFEHKAVRNTDETLLEFIKEKTGKIRPLAQADLESYIESGLQLLNIGKPFYIEGIGTVVKLKEGSYDFVARELSVNRDEQPAERKKERPQATEKKKSVFDDEKYSPSTNPWQKIIVAVLILGGLAIVVFGGYYLYMQTNDKAGIQEQAVPLMDTATINRPDTLNTQPADTARSMASYASSIQSGAFKFILETTSNKKRALRRYNQLKSYYLPIKLETQDSLAYKLYFLIPSTPSDTARIKDSLSRYYLSKVKIEL